MPVLVAIIISVIIVVLIVVHGKTKQTQSLAINQKFFEELAHELKADNAIMKSDLAAINKMMEEIE